MMKTPEEKYMADPAYHVLVDTMEQMIIEFKFTPSEMREAAVYACTRYEIRRPPTFVPFAYGEHLDAIGNMHGLSRAPDETDTDFRKRILSEFGVKNP
jgi:hypothetical protein